jgi:hypothetical protein
VEGMGEEPLRVPSGQAILNETMRFGVLPFNPDVIGTPAKGQKVPKGYTRASGGGLGGVWFVFNRQGKR